MPVQHAAVRSLRRNPGSHHDQQEQDRIRRELIEKARQDVNAPFRLDAAADMMRQLHWPKGSTVSSAPLAPRTLSSETAVPPAPRDPSTMGPCQAYAQQAIERIIEKHNISYANAVLRFLRFAADEPERCLAAKQEVNTPVISGVPVVDAPQSGTSLTSRAAGSSVIAFDQLVESIRASNRQLSYADSILRAAAQDPDLASRRNAELASGRVSMTSI
jgi:hypothetical protein